MFEWWKRRQPPATGTRTSDPGASGSEENDLVEYSEFVLVLSPEPLWAQWKKTGTPPDEE